MDKEDPRLRAAEEAYERAKCGQGSQRPMVAALEAADRAMWQAGEPPMYILVIAEVDLSKGPPDIFIAGHDEDGDMKASNGDDIGWSASDVSRWAYCPAPPQEEGSET